MGQGGQKPPFRKIGKSDRKSVPSASGKPRKKRFPLRLIIKVVIFQNRFEIFPCLPKSREFFDGRVVFRNEQGNRAPDRIFSGKPDPGSETPFEIPDRSGPGRARPQNPDPVLAADKASDRPSGRFGGDPVDRLPADGDKRPERNDPGRRRHANDHMTGEKRQSGGHLPAVSDDLRNGEKAGQNQKDQNGDLDRRRASLTDKTKSRRLHSARSDGVLERGGTDLVRTPGGGDVIPFVFGGDALEPVADFFRRPADIVVDETVQDLKSHHDSIERHHEKGVRRPDLGHQRRQDKNARLDTPALIAVSDHRLDVAEDHIKTVLALPCFLDRLGPERPVGRQGPPGQSHCIPFLSDPDDPSQGLPSHDGRDQNDNRVPDDLGVLTTAKIEIRRGAGSVLLEDPASLLVAPDHGRLAGSQLDPLHE